MNRWSGTGNLGDQPTLRYTQSGVAVVAFTIAVSDGYGDKKQTYWIDCVAWRQLAELIANSLDKGSKVGVEGKLTTRQWDDKEGRKRKSVEILVENIEFLSQKKSDSSQHGYGSQYNDPFANSKTVDLSDDDLPF